MKKVSGNEEESGNEKIGYGMYSETGPPPSLEAKTLEALRNRGLIGAPFLFKRTLLKATVRVLLIGFIFYAGMIMGKKDNTTTAIDSTDGGQPYLLLLYNSQNFIESSTHRKEYGLWMHSLIEKKQVVSGEELKKTGWQISMINGSLQVNNESVRNNKGNVSGFFLINATNETRAIEIAASCPHIKHNGMIELRPVQMHKKL